MKKFARLRKEPGLLCSPEPSGAAAPIASPGGKLSGNRLFGTDSLTDEECGRKPYDYGKSADLLLCFDLEGGLLVCANFRVFARIPLPALRATLPPGEGIAAFGGPATPGGVALRDEMQKN